MFSTKTEDTDLAKSMEDFKREILADKTALRMELDDVKQMETEQDCSEAVSLLNQTPESIANGIQQPLSKETKAPCKKDCLEKTIGSTNAEIEALVDKNKHLITENCKLQTKTEEFIGAHDSSVIEKPFHQDGITVSRADKMVAPTSPSSAIFDVMVGFWSSCTKCDECPIFVVRGFKNWNASWKRKGEERKAKENMAAFLDRTFAEITSTPISRFFNLNINFKKTPATWKAPSGLLWESPGRSCQGRPSQWRTSNASFFMDLCFCRS
ncbi:unnamed protein product [Caenorhabditis brenneri]